ncbi:uncharacterized protein LOC111675229 [Lucilia cuprina]|uniref:uncharacterized protein LOC111675229 n=1 Tax=Lucilia cuprina TaxID=7375 RepID=UPI001F06997A|nr:uncharacterized protein LOC111675229 [Lucilia cuprina]
MRRISEALRLKLTKVICKAKDESFVNFKTCHVKAESRNLQYIALYIKFLQLPINDINVRFRFMKRANGYKPFLYDFTFRCDFLKRLNLVSGLVWRWISDVSNLNHSCPLINDFEIKRFENRYMEKELDILPLVDGDYALFINFKVYNSSKFDLEVYVTIT